MNSFEAENQINKQTHNHKISDTAKNETGDSVDKDKDMNYIIHTHQ